jgi:hypothetical protein
MTYGASDRGYWRILHILNAKKRIEVDVRYVFLKKMFFVVGENDPLVRFIHLIMIYARI